MNPESALGALGPAAPSRQRLSSLVASALHMAPGTALALSFESVGVRPVDIPTLNMTTGGIWRVFGDVHVARGSALAFSMVVKLLQSALLWEHIAAVPEHLRAELAAHYPWRTEAQVYASGLAAALPPGMRLPEVWDIVELGGERVALWLEDVPFVPAEQWSVDHFAAAARCLGRFAGKQEVAGLDSLWDPHVDAERLRHYVAGVGKNVYIPAILGQELWQHPALAATAGTKVREGLRWIAARAEDLVEEMLALPSFPSHGDACPQNLLLTSGSARAGDAAFTAIDWGLCGWNCAGFDLGQLLAGRVHAGTLHGGELPALEPICMEAYCAGLADAGCLVEQPAVKRGHALSMAMFAGLNAPVTDRLQAGDSPELRRYMASRLAMAGFIVELVAATEP